MLKLIVHHFIQSENIENVTPLFRELVQKSQAEPLCTAYDLFVDQQDPGHFIFIEEWPNQAALDVHCNTEHFQRLVPQIQQYQKAPEQHLLMDAFK